MRRRVLQTLNPPHPNPSFMMIQVSDEGGEQGVLSCFIFVFFFVFSFGFDLISSMSIVSIPVVEFYLRLVLLKSLVRSYYKILIWNKIVYLVYWSCFGSEVLSYGFKSRGYLQIRLRSDGMRWFTMLLLMCLASLSQTQTLLKYTEITVMGVDYGCKVIQRMLIWPVSYDFVHLEMLGMEWTQQLMQIWSGYFDQGNCMDTSQMWSLWKFMLTQLFVLRYSRAVSLWDFQDVAIVGSLIVFTILTLPNLLSWVENATGLMLHSFKDKTQIVVILQRQRDRYK